MGLMKYLFGSEDEIDESTDETEDPDEEEELESFEVETEKGSYTSDEQLANHVIRSIDLLSFTNEQSMLVEYDEKSISGGRMEYKAFPDTDTIPLKTPYGPYANKDRSSSLETVTTVNDRNVLHEETLGSYDILVSQTEEIEVFFEDILNYDEIPEECMEYGSRPRTVPDRSGGPYIIRSCGSFFQRNNSMFRKQGYHVQSRKFVEGPTGLRWIDRIKSNGMNDDRSVEIEGSAAEVISNNLTSGTEVMHAVTANGTTVVPNDVQGLSDEHSDVMRIAEVLSDDSEDE